jgi:GH43 family beta-xylosidase
MWSKNVWAPELHWLDGSWYVYFAADNGRNRNHRLYILQNSSPDPMACEWVFRGQLVTPDDRWSIDGSVFTHNGQLYLTWSGWEGSENGQQNIYICRMKDPCTVAGDRVCISSPVHWWERNGYISKPGIDDKPYVYVNEGPTVLTRGGRIFIVYSGSGCWTDDYALGLLWVDGCDDLMDAASWHKEPEPVFRAAGSGAIGTHAAGHASFFKSPDATEDWIIYHANPRPRQGFGPHRCPRAQRFAWNEDGFPVFGTPLSAGEPVPYPAETVPDLVETQVPVPEPALS